MQTKTVTTTCDFCGYGDPYTDPKVFTRHKSFDLCRWCADTRPKAWIEGGKHRIQFVVTDGSCIDWNCSCGDRYVRPLFPSMVPDPVLATANKHLNA